jgi:tetratricopeptide (TPR) repeat protein
MMQSRFFARAGALAFAFGLASPVTAQTMAPMGRALPSADPAQTLSENLKALARDPYNVDALLQAGLGALAVGDPNAAFGFFARAEELSPSNARIKAGLGSSLTMMEKPRDALRAFDEATALGLPEADILEDRGLAHDLTGDARKAQKDYLAALKTDPSDELTRRLALSLGISGDKEAALARLDPLIRRNDQAAWRARAFILAMNGDSPGAEKIVRMVAPLPLCLRLRIIAGYGLSEP